LLLLAAVVAQALEGLRSMRATQAQVAVAVVLATRTTFLLLPETHIPLLSVTAVLSEGLADQARLTPLFTVMEAITATTTQAEAMEALMLGQMVVV
jgi:hypothetical protein